MVVVEQAELLYMVVVESLWVNDVGHPFLNLVLRKDNTATKAIPKAQGGTFLSIFRVENQLAVSEVKTMIVRIEQIQLQSRIFVQDIIQKDNFFGCDCRLA